MENIIRTKTIYEPNSAIFINDDKTTLNVNVIEKFVVKTFDNKEIEKENCFTRTINVEPSLVLDEFLSQVSLDDVEKNTKVVNEKLKEEATEFEIKVKQRVLKEIDKDLKVASTNATDMSDEDLFKMKLQAFEIDAVKNSTNRDLKKSLRQSKTFMESVAYTAAIIIAK